MTVETPDTVHGRLLEAAHISGYGFKRACDELSWLLDEDRWSQVGGGHESIDTFLATLDLSEFKIAIEQRKPLARRLAGLRASQRAIGRAIGVDETTVRRDLGKRAADAAADESEAIVEAVPSTLDAADAAAWFQDDVDPAKLAKGRTARKQRDQEAEQQRVSQIRGAGVTSDLPPSEIRHGDFREVLSDLIEVDAIITDPPYGREHLPLLADLAIFANEALAMNGVLAVLMGQTHLPEVYQLLGGHRPYRWTSCLLTDGPAYVSHSAEVQSNWKPIIVYGGGPRFADVIRSEGLDAAAKAHHKWGQDFAAFSTLIERLTKPGQLVVDPFCGSGTTLLAAQALGRSFIGSDIDAAAVDTSLSRVAA